MADGWALQRGAYLGHLTRLCNEIKIAVDDPDSSIVKLQALKEKLLLKLERIEEVSNRILSHLTDEEEEAAIREEVDKQDQYTNDAVDARTAVEFRIQQLTQQDSGSGSQSSVNKSVKLPKLELKKFSGDVIQWPEFWDMFKVAVDDNDDVPVIQKFVHLKTLLVGEAEKCIASVEMSAANYKTAVERLQTRYGQQDIHKHRLMAKLIDMMPLERGTKATRVTLDDLSATIRALEGQGVTKEQYGTLLMPLIESKLLLEESK